MTRSAAFHLALLLIFWTILIVVADCVIVITSYRQFAATHFSKTPGRMAQSDLGMGAIGRRGLVMRYTYTVGGKSYTGRRYRYDDDNAPVRWSDTTNEFHTHSEHPVYYNPKDPAESVLAPGIDGCDLLLLMFLVPFNVALGAVWLHLWRRERERRNLPLAGGVRILASNAKVSARLAEFSAGSVAFSVLAMAAFLAGLVVVFVFGFDESLPFMVALWGVVAGVAIAVCAFGIYKSVSGSYDLVIDHANGTVTIPPAGDRKAGLTLPRGDVAGVSVQRRSITMLSGVRQSYLPAILRNGPEGIIAEPLVNWGWSEDKALSFTRWLATELEADHRGIEEEREQLVAAV